MRHWLVPLLLGFGVMLAWIIGQRMSTDAMAVVIGVAVGVAASVPTSLLLVALLRRERHNYGTPPPATPPPPASPPLIVLNPAELLRATGQTSRIEGWLPPPEIPAEAGLPRLRVVGDVEEW